jgi:F-type H+-transporting ATPase subunit a
MQPTEQFELVMSMEQGSTYWIVLGLVVLGVIVAGSKSVGSQQRWFGRLVEFVGTTFHASVLCIIFTLFSYIATSNMLGLNGAVFAMHAQLSLCLALASVPFLVAVGIIVFRYGVLGLSMFCPAGVPLWLTPLLVTVELISYAFRLVSLSVRLFANITAGHCLLYLFSAVTWGIMSSFAGTLIGAVALPLVLAFLVLETGVAVIQAYIFCMLSNIYITEAL